MALSSTPLTRTMAILLSDTKRHAQTNAAKIRDVTKTTATCLRCLDCLFVAKITPIFGEDVSGDMCLSMISYVSEKCFQICYVVYLLQ